MYHKAQVIGESQVITYFKPGHIEVIRPFGSNKLERTRIGETPICNAYWPMDNAKSLLRVANHLDDKADEKPVGRQLLRVDLPPEPGSRSV